MLALQLQELWGAEEAAAAACPEAPRPEARPDPSSLRPLSVVDEAWELLDPSPDVHGLFVQFNETLFWGRLAAVEVSWSPRMTLYASGGWAGWRGSPAWGGGRGLRPGAASRQAPPGSGGELGRGAGLARGGKAAGEAGPCRAALPASGV